MSEKPQLTPEKHREQIEAYREEQPHCEIYAATLKRVLEKACAVSFPEAFVQSRPKSISSFAEKVARKFDKYPDAVHQMTDLCGARVIVQTTEQVAAIRLFIEANFTIVEKDDKALLLSDEKFGYRDMHYIVQLRPDRYEALEIKPAEQEAIDDRRAEIQVRTWVQHAWADTLHDRMYKNKLKISSDVIRTGALLAALMEEGDRTFNQMANDLDGLIANYTASASKDDVKKEIDVLELILNNEPKPEKKPGLAMKLARLVATSGDDARVVAILDPHAGIQDANRCELLLDLGYSLCRLHRGVSASLEYARGRGLLEEALSLCDRKDVPFAPHLRRHESLFARALTRLAWALEVIPGQERQAREYYHLAHEHEPANPYYLANMLGYEMLLARGGDLPATMRATLREAIKACLGHAAAEIELPSAYFTAGRLNILLGEADAALGCYARGISHCRAGSHCAPANALDEEIDWLRRLHCGRVVPPECRRAVDLLELGQKFRTTARLPREHSPLSAPVVIIAGGAESFDSARVKTIRPLIEAALADFSGTVISGGTTSGVPGCVGDVTGQLGRQQRKQFRLLGYLPERLPRGVTEDGHYDQSVGVGDQFSADQILRNWADILAAQIDPRDVVLLGFGGGPLAADEYRIALGLGASVGVVTGTGGAADELLSDPLWAKQPNLYPLPFDPTTLRAFVVRAARPFDAVDQEAMARSFHSQYLAGSSGRLPPNMRPWENLGDTFKKANVEQAKYSVAILEAAGFGVQTAKGRPPEVYADFTPADIEKMAELEHGRWNVERLRDGWRWGKERDDTRKIHDCLVPWSELPEATKYYDRNAVRKFPEILAQAKLEVFRR